MSDLQDVRDFIDRAAAFGPLVAREAERVRAALDRAVQPEIHETITKMNPEDRGSRLTVELQIADRYWTQSVLVSELELRRTNQLPAEYLAHVRRNLRCAVGEALIESCT